MAETQAGKVAGQVALVTGAAQGMGAEIARTLARHGAEVVLCDVNETQARQVAAEIEASGAKAMACKVDVTSQDEVDAVVAQTLERLGRVDILVNSAGILRPTRVEDMTKEEWDLVIDVNLNGTFLCSMAVLGVMQERGFGRIVNISSSAGRSVSTLGGIHYTAAKAGVLGLTRGMAKEVAPSGITVNAICPGLIDTEMVHVNCTPERIQAYADSFPTPRLGTPEEVAQLMLFLVADAAYITGASIDINGGDLML